MQSCLDILRRTDPRDAEKHLEGLAALVSNDAADRQLVDAQVPLKVGHDSEADGRKFLLCEHNRDGSSHRSPWSNNYFPPLDEGIRPSARLRSLELHANEVFDSYRQLYYGKATSVSSVYLWDNAADGVEGGGGGGEGTSRGFAGCFLVQNQVDRGNYWNSVNVVDVGKVHKGECTYKLTSTLLLSMTQPRPSSGDEEHDESTKANISGSLTRQNVRECKVPSNDGSHIINIGQLIEDIESEMRSEMESLYIPKTKTVAEGLWEEGAVRNVCGEEHANALNNAILAMALERKCVT